MTVPIVHPRFLASVPPGFWPSRCTIRAGGAKTKDAYGEEHETPADVAGLTGIPCAKAPLSAMERQAAGYTATDRVWSVLLQGAYSQITTNHQAVIDGEAFDIDAAETDQTGTVTRLRVRSVTT